MSTTPAFPPIRKTVDVKAPPDRAFARFTDEIATWWPLRSHSVGGDDAETVMMEGRVGGRIVETIRGGRECIWGTVTAWDPPRRVAFTWHPGHDPREAQDVDVRFTGTAAGTRVELVHVGFERLGHRARIARRGYPIGWTYVLGFDAQRSGPVMALLSGLTTVLRMAQATRARFRAPQVEG